MRYLYGDSTPSTLEVNFIEFLRDAVDFCVQVLLSDQRIVQGRAQTRALDQATTAEMERLQKLPPLVVRAFDSFPVGTGDSAAARCVAAISRSAADLARAEAVALRSALDGEIAKRDAQAAAEREGCVKALETLLVKHDLPDTARDVHLTMTSGGRYLGRARVKAASGLEALIDLEIPANHMFDRIVRVDRLAERLDVSAPEIGGWLHKEVKQKPQHLEKHHISELSIGAGGGTLKLRLNPDGTGAGFDVLFSRHAPHVRMLRADQKDAAAEPPFDVDNGDAKKLLAVFDKLVAAVAELGGHRRKLVDAKIDGEPMRAHAKPTLLVERLIAAIAPVVQEIAARSQSPGELVLRRLLAGDRREEIFLSKSELKAKLEPLADGNRTLFEPLWVSALPSAPAPAKQAPAAAASPALATTLPGGAAGAAAAPHAPPAPPAAAAAESAAPEPPRARITPAIGSPALVVATAPSGSFTAPPTAEPPRAQTIRPRPPTPTTGTHAVAVPATAAAAAAAAANANATGGSLGDVFRRTLLGTTASQLDMPPPLETGTSSPPKPPAPEPKRSEPPRSEPPRTEAAGTIDVKRGKATDPS